MPAKIKPPVTPPGTAKAGVEKLIAHLESTGTGKAKLDVARKTDTSGYVDDQNTEKNGAQAVVEHLKAHKVNDVTIAKAQEYIDDGMGEVTPPSTPVPVIRQGIVQQNEAVLKKDAPKPTQPSSAPVAPK